MQVYYRLLALPAPGPSSLLLGSCRSQSPECGRLPRVCGGQRGPDVEPVTDVNHGVDHSDLEDNDVGGFDRRGRQRRRAKASSLRL